MMMFIVGCATNTPVTESFCLWATPITITKHELDVMSDETLREIYTYNQIYDLKCKNKD